MGKTDSSGNVFRIKRKVAVITKRGLGGGVRKKGGGHGKRGGGGKKERQRGGGSIITVGRL